GGGTGVGGRAHTALLPAGGCAPGVARAIERGPGGRGTASPPRSHVSVREMLGGVERLTVHADEMLARLRPAASSDAPEGRAVGQQAPESTRQTERRLDDELGQVVWEVSPRGHRGSLKALTLRWRRHPCAQASVVHLVEGYLHTRRLIRRS